MNAHRLVLAIAGAALLVPLAGCAGEATGPSSSPALSSPGETTDSSRVLDVSALESGAAPGLAYADLGYIKGLQRGGTIHTADGDEVPLPPFALNQFVPFGTGWIVAMSDPNTGDGFVISMSADGEYSGRTPVSGGIAVGPGGRVVAWTGPDGTVSAMELSDDQGVRTLGSVPGDGPNVTIGITSESCAASHSEDASCSVVVADLGGAASYDVTSLGDVTPISGIRRATAVDGGRVGGVHSIDESKPGSCSRMLRWPQQQLMWKTCDYTLGAIGPGGKNLVGLPAYLDGFGPGTLAILSMDDGTPVHFWGSTPDSATHLDQVWENTEHLLIRTYQQGEWAIVRVGLDGTLEYAVAPVAGSDLNTPFLLQSR